MSVSKKKIKILAIETSCDETSASVIEKIGSKTKILSNTVSSQINIHKKFGGVFPEHASRAHSERIVSVVENSLSEALATQSNSRRSNLHGSPSGENLTERVGSVESLDETTTGIFDVAALSDNFDLIAVTTGPGLIGSLLVGVNFAKTLAYTTNKPIIGINHWLGHIYSNFVEEIPQFPALILIVSGGHTGLVLMKSHTDIQTLGETLDDAAGEAFDKVAKLLGLDYPGGPAISKIAQKGNSTAYKFPRSMLDRKNYDFSFSGLKTAVLYESKKHRKLSLQKKADFAASFQQAVIDILVGKTIQAAYEFRPKSICLCGGVSANKELRQQLKMAVEKLPTKTSYHTPPMELTTDNAAMVAIAAAYQLATDERQLTTWDKINADSNAKLD
ncbi:MAG: tRNA (adenosine(37)-N6)-threonylcarbamoyltransferase complex transferase subunit TsaD [Patescibacteria group bacterium]